MIEIEFDVVYCPVCLRDVVICPKCGNNCCNGGYGEVDGQPCDMCPEAYDMDSFLCEMADWEAASDEDFLKFEARIAENGAEADARHL